MGCACGTTAVLPVASPHYERQPRKGSLKVLSTNTATLSPLRPITPKPPICSDPWQLHPSLRVADREDNGILFLPTTGIYRQYTLIWKPKSATKPSWCSLNVERRHTPLLLPKADDRFRIGLLEMFAKPRLSRHTRSRSVATPSLPIETFSGTFGKRKALSQCLMVSGFRSEGKQRSPSEIEDTSQAWNRLSNEAHALKVYAHRTAVLEGILGMNVMLAAPPISLPEIRTIPHVQPLAFDTWFEMAVAILHTLTLAHESGIFYNGVFCPEMIIWDGTVTTRQPKEIATQPLNEGKKSPLLSSLPASPSISLRKLRVATPHHVRAQTSSGLARALNNLKPPSPEDTKGLSGASSISASASPSGIGSPRTIFSRPMIPLASAVTTIATLATTKPLVQEEAKKEHQRMALADTRSVARLLFAYLTNEISCEVVFQDKTRYHALLASAEPVVLVLLAGIVGDLVTVKQLLYELLPFRNQIPGYFATTATKQQSQSPSQQIAWLCPPLSVFALATQPQPTMSLNIPVNKQSLDAWFSFNMKL